MRGSLYEKIDVPVEVRTHARARSLTLRVRRHPRAVIVTTPVQCDQSEADALIIRNLDWIRECLDSIPKPVPFHDGALLPLRGLTHRLVFTCKREAGGVVQRTELTTGCPELRVGGNVEHAPRRFLDWLYEEVWWDLYVSIIQHSQRLNVTAPRLTICDQSSCWASCSTIGALSVSWRLILMPPFVLDYIIAHEIAHLVEMNHSRKFWALVERATPRMEEAKDWLDCEGPDLHRYGPVKARRKGK